MELCVINQFTFYSIYIKTFVIYMVKMKLKIFTFYSIYIKTAHTFMELCVIKVFTFYSIYIKTSYDYNVHKKTFNLHSTLFILKL